MIVRAKRLRVAAALAAGALALTGCGGMPQPGVAARIGGETITVRQVDEAAEDMCRLSRPQLESSGQVVPLGLMRTRALQLLVIAALARQVAEEHAVEPTERYATQVVGFEQTAERLPEELRDTYIELSSAVPYSDAVTQQVGRQSLVEDGVETPAYSDQVARGRQIMELWPLRHDVSIDPRYGVSLVDGEPVRADTDVSYALSPAALAGQSDEVDMSAAGLPAAQRCG